MAANFRSKMVVALWFNDIKELLSKITPFILASESKVEFPLKLSHPEDKATLLLNSTGELDYLSNQLNLKALNSFDADSSNILSLFKELVNGSINIERVNTESIYPLFVYVDEQNMAMAKNMTRILEMEEDVRKLYEEQEAKASSKK